MLVIVGGIKTMQQELDKILETHSGNCDQVLQFGKGENCVVAMCDKCDFCYYLGGF